MLGALAAAGMLDRGDDVMRINVTPRRFDDDLCLGAPDFRSDPYGGKHRSGGYRASPDKKAKRKAQAKARKINRQKR